MNDTQLFLNFGSAPATNLPREGTSFTSKTRQRNQPEPAPHLTPKRPAHTMPTLPEGADFVQLDGERVPVHYRRNNRARRYLLRLSRDGRVQVTIPYAGRITEARDFIHSKRDWLLRQWHDFRKRDQVRREAQERSLVWFRGRLTPVSLLDRGSRRLLRINGEEFAWSKNGGNTPRAQALHALHKLAGQELPERTRQLAEEHGIAIKRVVVRNQKSRWGSCSSKGTISLNWRLVQTPRLVRDYIIIHELMHRRQMNHSAKYWELVAAACPQYESAEAWLKEHGGQLMDE